jgi:hypothetical protein
MMISTAVRNRVLTSENAITDPEIRTCRKRAETLDTSFTASRPHPYGQYRLRGNHLDDCRDWTIHP